MFPASFKIFLSPTFFRTPDIVSETDSASFSLNPLVVIAGVPILIPEGSWGPLLSSGITFLLIISRLSWEAL